MTSLVKKILVTGNAGSGKTTLGNKISKQLKLNLYGLDSIVWKPGWVETPVTVVRQKIQELVALDTWVIDGVSSLVFNAADTVVFLDTPLYRCLYNIIKRFFSNAFKTRESLPENCPEYIGVFKAIRVAFLYQLITRPHLLNLIVANPQKKILYIKSYKEMSHLNFSAVVSTSIANDENKIFFPEVV